MANPAPRSEPAEGNRFERRRQRNREALLDAAFALFQRDGLRATPVEAICARADVSPRTFFNHFETREHLYAALTERRMPVIVAAIEEAGEGDGALEERLGALFRAVGAYLSARPAYRELVGTMLRLPGEGASADAREGPIGRAARAFIDAAARRGELNPRHAPAVLADLVVGALVAAVTNWCASDDYDVEAELAAAARALAELLNP